MGAFVVLVVIAVVGSLIALKVREARGRSQATNPKRKASRRAARKQQRRRRHRGS